MPRKMLCRTRNALFPSLSALLVAACAALPGTHEPSGERPCVPCPSCAPCSGAAPAATPGAPAAPAAPAAAALQASDWGAIEGWQRDELSAAWPALRASCSTLVRQAPWKAACEEAARLGGAPDGGTVRRFLESRFTPWQVVNPDGSANGLVTGYYEPLIRGSRTRGGRSTWPIHGVPQDMLTIELADVYPELKSLRLRGRLVGNKVLPYWNRQQLSERQVPAPVLLWADDPIELFFLQVQGSGRVQLPDGSLVRVGYADQNGHPYQSIGRWLVAQGELTLDKASMDGIKRWAQDNPRRLQELLNANPSYVFFRELPASGGGPVGALGVPLSEGRSIAVDPRYVPLGAPVFLSTTQPLSERPLERLVMAQDTGGAIKGAVRADFFWGFGAEAGREAGKMRQQGRMWVLLPRGMKPPMPH
ncbi:murein transglycosylase A [Thauera aminoaromatica]|uniref:murein transglycosylase A n=1 Tax=Thauera aminoaromatica TaxID=164330 RepID=UPI003B58CF37